MSLPQIIVVGGGLSGLSAAHTVLERGGRVLLLDKQPFMGGNSVKATSGINGTLTKTQIRLGIKDSPDQFLEDTAISAAKGAPNWKASPLHKVLAYESGPAVEWLTDKFGLDLSLVSRLGGHSFPRTHRGKERFPGMTITYALMEAFEEASRKEDGRARFVMKARVTRLHKAEDGSITGVDYEKDGQVYTEHGFVILATGGYGADFGRDSVLMQHRPDLGHLPTTNGEHCTGDGIKMAQAVGGGVVDLTAVQVHPTGLVHPDEPDAKVKFLAAEALRGVGGILLDRDGVRFCDELGRRDYVTGEMQKRNKGPYRLILNGAASKEIEWHCKHYCGRKLMKAFPSGAAVAAELGVRPEVLADTFRKYNEVAQNKSCPFGKKFFHNLPFRMDDNFHVAIVTPVVHYTMGGVHISPEAEIMAGDPPSTKAIRGLYATGELCGGVHGQNRLGGSSLLDCVVFGRVAGATATRHLLENHLRSASSGQGRLDKIAGHVAGRLTIDINVGDGGSITISQGGAAGGAAAPQAAAPAPQTAPAAPAAPKSQDFTLADVAKHNKEDDCWVVVNGEVLNATEFLNDHPGGKHAIMLFAGRDASAEFNMLHKPDVVAKFAPQTVIGKLKE